MTLLASLRDWLKAQQLDAVLLSSRQNKQPHLGISTGSGYVVISRESAHILVDSRYYVEVEARAQGYQLHLLDATNTLTTIVNQIIADEQLQTLGFEGQQVSWETAHRWQSELNAKLVSATPDVLRQIKTPEEVEKIRLAEDHPAAGNVVHDFLPVFPRILHTHPDKRLIDFCIPVPCHHADRQFRIPVDESFPQRIAVKIMDGYNIPVRKTPHDALYFIIINPGAALL